MSAAGMSLENRQTIIDVARWCQAQVDSTPDRETRTKAMVVDRVGSSVLFKTDTQRVHFQDNCTYYDELTSPDVSRVFLWKGKGSRFKRDDSDKSDTAAIFKTPIKKRRALNLSHLVRMPRSGLIFESQHAVFGRNERDRLVVAALYRANVPITSQGVHCALVTMFRNARAFLANWDTSMLSIYDIFEPIKIATTWADSITIAVFIDLFFRVLAAREA
ncbi:hypothetical protein BKA67DRAFT_536746 [Truncatella angustata]|uniref:Uncharacterized protein n=1 Tax=Truncatella angustata TaxID=152316 RepID=A0A9P8ZXJ3_9PEZI|nr:uncharacterized protein BKA67DRAFT_536746 [Truncatella angustata]KAH6653044.1 hypothetical protein BKA67DRAFT_536746 [Truncatella angustata]